MADQEQQPIGNIRAEYNTATTGMNMDNTVNQVPKGMLTYALNAAVENFDSSSVNYQNEPGNEFCVQFPEGYQLIGNHPIYEKNKHIFFLVNPDTEGSEIGYMENNDCIYHTYVNAPCLNFNVEYPIHKTVHKITNCNIEIYWTDGYNARRYLDLTDITSIYTVKPGTDVCANETIPVIDCNKLKVQPNFSIPSIAVTDITTGGDLTAGTYQFAIQYCDSLGNGYTSYYSVTNPTPIADVNIITLNFNYQVGRSIVLTIKDIDVTGYYDYFNLAVIKSINAITSVELVGTYFIDRSEKNLTYTGQSKTDIRLSINDIFEKFPYYDIAQDLTAVQDILVWDQLTSIDRVNYQKIANQITLQWQTHRLPGGENYRDELNATNYRGYLRDEVYAFEIVFLLKNGKQTDGFHIPGRALNSYDLSFSDVPNTNPDFIGEPTYIDQGTNIGYSPYWKIYNTGRKIGDSPEKSTERNYKGAWEYGDFAYWESTEVYPCNELVWGDLANQPIRHHKFPDVLVSPIFESATPTITSGKYTVEMQTNDAIFPIGVKLDVAQVYQLIQTSDLTNEQKNDIMAFKIVRGNRGTNKSIVAKGILRNVGKYDRGGTSYYYPNYPYNDLREDPFLLNISNAYLSSNYATGSALCRNFTVTASINADVVVKFLNCSTLDYSTTTVPAGQSASICSVDFPAPEVTGDATISCNTYTRYYLSEGGPPSGILGQVAFTYIDAATCKYITQILLQGKYTYINSLSYPTCEALVWNDDCDYFSVTEVKKVDKGVCVAKPQEGFKEEETKYRLIFNSPETSFGNPFLGNVLKLENVMFGAGKAHFTQVKKNAYYKLLTKEAQEDALTSSKNIAGGDITAMFTAYQAYLTIYINGITRRNYAYSFNSIANYDYHDIVPHGIEIKQRPIEIAQYLIPVVQATGDDLNINNWNRESSVYIKTDDNKVTVPVTYDTINICNTNVTGDQTFATIDPFNSSNYTYTIVQATQCVTLNSTIAPVRTSGGGTFTVTSSGVTTVNIEKNVDPLPFPSNTTSIFNPSSGALFEEDSRFTISQKGNCDNPEKDIPISVISYYASMKNIFVNQWGQMYSYDTIDTGFQRNIDSQSFNTSTESPEVTIFGGDTFISRFAFKIKLPFFIDNRVGAPDDSDIFYDEIGNVAYPQYWHSSRSVLSSSNNMTNIISIKAHWFDCPNKQNVPSDKPSRTYYDGKFYLFAYGVPNFYCESSYNVDLRQAFNNREGDLWPHVSTSIPDDWVQESFVPIAQDNTYYYNVTYSKQNKENFFTHLPVDWTPKLCYTYFPFKAIYSDRQVNYLDNRANNWLIYRPVSAFDFPQNYGKLVSLDGIQNRAILARFENKTLLYNKLLTIDTSNPQAAYIGNDKLFAGAPPIDFAETDLGYVGSQHKFLLKIPQGQISVDAKRGQVFLLGNEGAVDLSAFGSGLNRFFTDHLAFEILRYFPEVNIDNHFNGIGLHGTYDSKYDRVIISKLDYIPHPGKNVKYDPETKEFYVEEITYVNPITTTTTTTIPPLNVTEHGVVGNGETDNTEALRELIIYAEDNGFDKIYFPAGEYMVSSGFNLPDNITVYGDGDSSVIKLISGLGPLVDGSVGAAIFQGRRTYGDGDNFDLPQWENSSKTTLNITIKKLKIDLQRDPLNFDPYTYPIFGGIRLFNAVNCLIENVTVVNTWAFGIRLATTIDGQETTNNTIKNCTVTSQEWYISTSPSYIPRQYPSLLGIEFFSYCDVSTANGAACYNKSPTFCNDPNKIIRGYPPGSYTPSRTHNNTITGCSVSNGSHCIQFTNAKGNTVTNNTLYNGSNRGIVASSRSDDNTFSHNSVSFSGSAGILLGYNSCGNQILNNVINTVRGGEGEGIAAIVLCQNNVIKYNTISSCPESGIRVAHGPTGNIVQYNTITGNNQVDQKGIIVLANWYKTYCIDKLQYGDALRADDNTIEYNSISNVNTGIYLGDEKGFIPSRLSGNVVSSNTYSNTTTPENLNVISYNGVTACTT